jgi:hypothetical protein
MAFATFALAIPATALETQIGVRAASSHTNNTLRTPDNEVDEVTYQPGVAVQVQHQGSAIRANGNYDYERRIRTEDFYDDTDAVTGASTVVWQALPGRLDLTVTNTRTETTVDALQANTPDNLQITDSTRAGATLRFRVRNNDEIQLQYFHTMTTADVANTDSQRDTLSASYVMNVGQNDQLVFNVTDNRVNFDAAAAPDLNAITGSLQWNRFGPSVDMSLMAGYTTIDRDLGRDEVKGEVFDARLTWRITPQTSLGFGVARDIRDRPFIVELGVLPFGTNTQIDSDLNEVFHNDRADINFRTVFLSNELLLNIAYEKQDYVDLFDDVKRLTAAVNLRRRLSPKLTVELDASWRDQNPLIAGIVSDERIGGGVTLGYTHSRRLSFLLSGNYNSLESAQVINTYDEMLYTLRVNYLLLE